MSDDETCVNLHNPLEEGYAKLIAEQERSLDYDYACYTMSAVLFALLQFRGLWGRSIQASSLGSCLGNG